VFRLTKPSAAVIESQIAAAAHSLVDGPQFLRLPYGVRSERIALEFAHDDSRSLLGQGVAVFDAAKLAFKRWAMFDLGWARVANPQARIEVGQILAVEVRSLDLWTLNLSRITEVIDTPTHFGFIYTTTERHVEQGDERFLLEFDVATGDVWYELEAVSRPRHLLARIGYPITRSFQRRFARDSHARMREETLAGNTILS